MNAGHSKEPEFEIVSDEEAGVSVEPKQEHGCNQIDCKGNEEDFIDESEEEYFIWPEDKSVLKRASDGVFRLLIAIPIYCILPPLDSIL